jgi:hypothetical protein
MQEQLSELLRDGVSREEIQEVKKSFADMGMDLEVRACACVRVHMCVVCEVVSRTRLGQ